MIAILPNQLAVDCLAICSILYRCFYLFQNLINIVYFSVIYLFINLFTTRQAFLVSVYLLLFIFRWLSSHVIFRCLSSDVSVYLQIWTLLDIFLPFRYSEIYSMLCRCFYMFLRKKRFKILLLLFGNFYIAQLFLYVFKFKQHKFVFI